MRCTAALVVVGVHVALFLLMRDELLRQHPSAQSPVFVSLFVPSEIPARPPVSGPRPKRREGARTSVRSEGARASVVTRSSVESPTAEPRQSAPLPITPPRVHWLDEAELAARDQIESDADRKRRANWLSRGADPETHPLVLAMRPMFGKTPEFGWSHEHTHRIEHPPGGPLVFWINKRCAIAFVGIAIIGGCAIGHMEPNGALFEHMDDADLDFTPAP